MSEEVISNREEVMVLRTAFITIPPSCYHGPMSPFCPSDISPVRGIILYTREAIFEVISNREEVRAVIDRLFAGYR